MLNSTFVDRGPGYLTYKFILFLGVLIPIAALDILIIISTCLEKSITHSIRIALLNIPVSSLVVISGFVADHIAAVHLTLARNPHSPPPQPCYLIVYTIGVGAAARLVFMALFAVMTFLIVRCGQHKTKPAIFGVTSLSLWLFLFLFNIPIVIPSLAGVDWDDGVSCRPVPESDSAYAFIGVDLVLFGIVPFLLTIVMPLVTYCYIRKSVITEDLNTKKVLVKFALFLILGNVLCVMGLAVPVLLASLPPSELNPTVDAALLRTANIVTHLSLVPTPILILFYFPAIWSQLLNIFEFFFCIVCRKAGCDYKKRWQILCHYCKENRQGPHSKENSTQSSSNITK